MCTVFCSICWENVGKNDELLATSCGHLFHARCIQSWLRQSETCPQCRADCTSPHQLFLTFEDSLENTTFCNAGVSPKEINRDVSPERVDLNDLQNELCTIIEMRRIDTERYQKEIQCLEVKIASMEIQLQELLTKDKTLREAFHYKLQDLNIEFHYKFQELKLSKEELLENLNKSRNVEFQLRNSVDEAHRLEEQLRKSLREYSNKIMDLEIDKADLQSKIETLERNTNWVKQSINELQKEICRWQVNLNYLKSRRRDESFNKHIENYITENEEVKRKMGHMLHKLHQEIYEYDEKQAKRKELSKGKKSSQDMCVFI